MFATRGSYCSRRFPLFQISALSRCQKRSLLTEIIEPSDGGNDTEYEGLLILAEDEQKQGYYIKYEEEESWHHAFADAIPNQYGIPYSKLTFQHQKSARGAIYELKRDIEPFEKPILVTRGSWTSFMAQYYLQMHQLHGLVMINPLVLDAQVDKEIPFKPPRYDPLDLKGILPIDPAYYRSEFSRQWPNHYEKEHLYWEMKLQPGVTPMLVMTTRRTLTLDRHSYSTADRHSKEGHNVPLHRLEDPSVDEVMEIITGWIQEENLL